MDFTGERMIPEYNSDMTIYGEHIVRYLYAKQFVKDRVVLDIACGSGYGTNILAKSALKKIYGLDISSESIKYANEHYSALNCEFLLGDAEKINFENNFFDIVTSFETIEHLNNYINFLENVKRVLRKEGVFIVSTPNKATYPSGNPYHIKEFFIDEFELELKKYFNYVYIKYQDNFISNIIYKDINKNKSLLAINENINLEPLYIIAVCSDIKIDIDNYNDISYATAKESVVFAPITDTLNKISIYNQELKKHAENLGNERTVLKKHAENLENERTVLKKHAENLENERAVLKKHAENLENECTVLKKHAENLEKMLYEKSQHNQGLAEHTKNLEQIIENEKNILHKKLEDINRDYKDTHSKLIYAQKYVQELEEKIARFKDSSKFKILKKFKLINPI